MNKNHLAYEQLDEFRQPLGNFLGRDNAVHLLSEQDTWRPPVNIRETSGGYVLEVELPGFGSEEVFVEVEEDVLMINCARETEEFDYKVIRRERPLGCFHRNFKLPDNTAPEHISARMQAGVLLINVPKSTAPNTSEG